jgi:hypothetical protein
MSPIAREVEKMSEVYTADLNNTDPVVWSEKAESALTLKNSERHKPSTAAPKELRGMQTNPIFAKGQME